MMESEAAIAAAIEAALSGKVDCLSCGRWLEPSEANLDRDGEWLCKDEHAAACNAERDRRLRARDPLAEELDQRFG